MFKVSGISGKVQADDDDVADAADVDVAVTEMSRRALVETLGKDRRDQVLSALYIVRQDAVSTVRQAAVHIWKALVHNTPRTGKYLPVSIGFYLSFILVRELLPVLVSEIISLLTNSVVESQEVSPTNFGLRITVDVTYRFTDGFSYNWRDVSQIRRKDSWRDCLYLAI